MSLVTLCHFAGLLLRASQTTRPQNCFSLSLTHTLTPSFVFRLTSHDTTQTCLEKTPRSLYCLLFPPTEMPPQTPPPVLSISAASSAFFSVALVSPLPLLFSPDTVQQLWAAKKGGEKSGVQKRGRITPAPPPPKLEFF